MSAEEENKALARCFLEAQAKGDLETLDELMAPDFVDRSVLPGQGSGREDYKQSVVEMLAAFTNTSLTIESQIAEEWSESDFLSVLEPAFEQEMRMREHREQELRIARLIQQTLLPKTLPQLPSYDVAAYYQPAREVGGDFYDFMEL
ncbi:MAG TPA: ester cyclase, partial [Rubrobacteraceae bacterium]|nr:ester cyclase [Rubrobacteraceae bacterium]